MSPHKPRGKKNKHPAKLKQKEGKKAMSKHVFKVEITPPVKTEIPQFVEAYKATHKNDESWHDQQYAVSIWTLILLALTAFFALWQGCSAKNAAQAARDSADTATKNLDAFKNVVAAQVIIDFSPTVKNGKKGEGLLVNGTIDVTNKGQTSAVNFSAKGYLWEQNLSAPIPGEPTMRQATSSLEDLDVTSILLASQSTQQLPIGFQITHPEEIRNGTWKTAVFIDATYNDVFDKPHPFSDCFMVNRDDLYKFVRCPDNQFHRNKQ